MLYEVVMEQQVSYVMIVDIDDVRDIIHTSKMQFARQWARNELAPSDRSKPTIKSIEPYDTKRLVKNA